MAISTMSMRIACVGLIAISVAGNAFAQANTSPDEQSQGRIEEIQKAITSVIEKGLNFLSTTMGEVVPYKLPEVLPNGDIIIRYVPPKPPEPESPEPLPEQPDDMQRTDTLTDSRLQGSRLSPTPFAGLSRFLA